MDGAVGKGEIAAVGVVATEPFGAGVRLAELATETPQQARALQQRMRDQLSESDFMPAIDNLPPSIMELEFKQRYQNLDSEKYALVDDEMERRIQHCPVYQPVRK